MNYKKYLSVGVLLCVLIISLGCVICNKKSSGEKFILISTVEYKKPSVLDTTNNWYPVMSILPGDTTYVVKVGYTQKYGAYVELFCAAVFRNDKIGQYRFIAPWLDIQEVERSNINDISYSKVLIDSSNLNFLKR